MRGAPQWTSHQKPRQQERRQATEERRGRLELKAAATHWSGYSHSRRDGSNKGPNRNLRHGVMASSHSHNGQSSCDLHLTTKRSAFRTLGIVLIDRHFPAHVEFFETKAKEFQTGPPFANAMFYQLTLVSKESVVGSLMSRGRVVICR